MGKSDKDKKYSKFLVGQNIISTKEPNIHNGSKTLSNIQTIGKINTLVMDLTSLEENKRLNACNVICNVFSSLDSNTDHSIMQKYINKEVISALSLRLVDNSDRVRHSAGFAVRNITACGDVDVNTMLISSGSVGTICEWVASLLTSAGSGNAAGVERVIQASLLLEQLLAILCNIR